MFGLSAAAGAWLLGGTAGRVAAAAEARKESAPAGRPNQPASALKPFALKDVRLDQGPFERAQSLDEAYLLQLDPDRLLHGFRVNAGLQPKGALYGGWESEDTWADLHCQGHTLGHYLSACSFMAASTGRGVFKQRVDYIVSELHACQAANWSGLICAFPDGAVQLQNSVSGGKVQGVPWYTMHKIFAGLRDAYVETGNAQALEILVKLSDWVWTLISGLSPATLARMLEPEHGGMNEVLADVFHFTGDQRHLTLARNFCHRAILTPLAAGRDELDGLHANTQIPKVTGFARLYEVTGDPEYLRAAQFFWQTVVSRRTFAIGGVGDEEHFFPPEEFADHLGSAKTMETCCAYNLLRLTRLLFQHDPTVAYADYYERTLYNSILASQDPDSGMMTYFQPTRPGYLKLYCTPTRSFWCCTGTGMENHAKYTDSIYFHDADSLYVNLFIPSAVAWHEKRVTLRQDTRFPESDTTRLVIEGQARFGLKIRHPSWCDEVTIEINNRPETISRSPGTWIPLERMWRSGDSIAVRLPMRVRAEELPGRPDTVALLCGPIVLAGRFGRDGIAAGADLIASERMYGEVLNAAVDVPAWVGRASDFANSVTLARQSPLAFRARGFERGKEIELVPYYRIAHERYNLYWSLKST